MLPVHKLHVVFCVNMFPLRNRLCWLQELYRRGENKDFNNIIVFLVFRMLMHQVSWAKCIKVTVYESYQNKKPRLYGNICHIR